MQMYFAQTNLGVLRDVHVRTGYLLLTFVIIGFLEEFGPGFNPDTGVCGPCCTSKLPPPVQVVLRVLRTFGKVQHKSASLFKLGSAHQNIVESLSLLWQVIVTLFCIVAGVFGTSGGV